MTKPALDRRTAMTALASAPIFSTAALASATADPVAPPAWQGGALITQAARLHQTIIALESMIDACDTADDCPRFHALRALHSDAEMTLATAKAQCAQDMAYKIWAVRHELRNAGTVPEAILADAARMIGRAA